MYRYLWTRTIELVLSSFPFFKFAVVPQAMNMPFFIRFSFLLVLLVGCNKANELTFEPVLFQDQACETCTKVSIARPKALGKSVMAATINAAVDQQIISALSFDGDKEPESITEAISTFKNNHGQMKAQQMAVHQPWQAAIEATVIYEDTTHLTIKMKTDVFTGGAHAHKTTSYLNFDKKKGKKLAPGELFADQIGFQAFAETKFREQEAIPEGKPINHTGLMFESDLFYLPDNIGYTPEGIRLLYNPYEVASFADGAITLTLPYAEVERFLVGKTKS